MKAMLAAALILAGCEGGEERPAVDGAWSIFNPSTNCAVGLTINGSSYTGQVLCLLQGGSAGSDIETGDFQVDQTRMGFAPRRASCHATEHTPQVFDYRLSGDTLSLVEASGVLIFKRIDPMKAAGGEGGVLEFGCWNDDGTFTPSPLRDL